tara:strand:+ start:3493 stop:3801 length:309 start_codon:yes stop_codon:yes gene_type:complete
MIVYNVTMSVDESITSDWLNWMKNEYIPQVMACGFFIKAKIYRVIAEADTNNTFAIAYSCLSIKDLHQYQLNFSKQLQMKHIARYGDKAVAFRTIMETIEEF